MIGMQSAVTRELPPFVVSMGVPAKAARLNTYRLDKLGVQPDQHEVLEAVLLRDSDDLSGLDDALRRPISAWRSRRDGH